MKIPVLHVHKKAGKIIFRNSVTLIVFLCFFISAFFLFYTSSNAESPSKNILIINSYTRDFTWTADEIDGILTTTNSAPYTVSTFMEYLDWKNFPYGESLQKQLDLIKFKYDNKDIDLIIATDDAAVGFSLTLRKELFGDIPIVFTGIYRDTAEKLVSENSNITGCVEAIDPETTLKTAFSIYPDAKKVYVIHDNTESGIASEEDVRKAVQRLNKDVEVTNFGNLRLSNLDEGIPADYADCILYMTSYSRDDDGITLQVEKMSELLSKKLNAPIFDAYDITLGSGIIGGSLLSGVLQGKKAGELALRILNGESTSNIPIIDNHFSVNKYDYNVLKRFNISRDLIPDDSIVINKPFSFYENYKRLVWNVILAFTALILFCIFMILNSIKRKKAEAKLLVSNNKLITQYTELEKSREIIRKNEERYKLVFETSNDGLWDFDPISGERYYTERWYDIFGFKKDNNLKTLEDWYTKINKDDVTKIMKLVDDLLEGKIDTFSVEYRIIEPDGKLRWIYSRARSVKDETGRVIRVVGSHSDIHNRKLQEEQIRALAYFDSLTGLPNRAQLTEAFEKLRKENSESAALVFIDLDNFKEVNDSLGHTNGDKFLIEVGKRLSELFANQFLVARLGGDEFAILMKGVTEKEIISQYLDVMKASINNYVILNDIEISMSASFGIAIYPKDGQDFNELLKNADIAMYRAKAHGKHNYVFFESYMQDNLVDKMMMENYLRTALENNEFILHYQPQCDLKNRKVFGFEALIRWESPVYGRVSPLRFISLAEETGLIVPLGKWVIEQACLYIRELHSKGYTDLMVSVNVSVTQVLQSDFTDMVLKIIKDTGIDSKFLNIEITESIFMESIDSNIDKISLLRENGISVSLDDFGKGYSSFTYLQQMSIDYLKIDKDFIQKSMEEHKSRSITGAIITLAHKLGLKVVAEGVETEAQYSFLLAEKCDYVQGFLISQPVDKEATYKLLNYL